jgi:hypothetical protein
MKTKAIEQIEKRMAEIDENSIRYQILQNAKNFKTSWIELGRSLYSVWRDKLYKEWGYVTFEAYTSKEIGLKKTTVMKLLRSYYFLEKEEPAYLDKGHMMKAETASIPTYESVNLLRLAKKKSLIDENDYVYLRRNVLEKGKDVAEVRKDLTMLMRQREEFTPQEAREQRRVVMVKRFLSTLKALKRELEAAKIVPASVIKEASNLIDKIESNID